MIKVIIDKYKDGNYISFKKDKTSNYAWNILYDELKKYNIDLTKEDIKINKNGKPFIDKNIYFNISHSKDLVAIAISDSEVGVDIEYLTRFKKYFDPLEWVKRESIIKLNGDYITLDKMRNLDYDKYVTNITLTDTYVVSVINKKGDVDVIWEMK